MTVSYIHLFQFFAHYCIPLLILQPRFLFQFYIKYFYIFKSLPYFLENINYIFFFSLHILFTFVIIYHKCRQSAFEKYFKSIHVSYTHLHVEQIFDFFVIDIVYSPFLLPIVPFIQSCTILTARTISRNITPIALAMPS